MKTNKPVTFKLGSIAKANGIKIIGSFNYQNLPKKGGKQ